MPNWREIQKAAGDGTLDKAERPFLIECRRELDRLVNANSLIQPELKLLSERVNKLIEALQQRELTIKSNASEQKRHDEKLALDREAVTVSKEALGISKEANKISVDANCISNKANDISKHANTLSKWAIWFAGLALLVSVVQLTLCWGCKANKSLPGSTPVILKPRQEQRKQPGSVTQTSNSMSTTSTNYIPSRTPATNSP
jgi:hypothetical protein